MKTTPIQTRGARRTPGGEKDALNQGVPAAAQFGAPPSA
jgi:hypothetical protein